MSKEYHIDVSEWYVKEWKNDINLYNACYKFFDDFPPRCSGVYYIYKEDELMYIGCTVDFKSRVTGHLVRGTNSAEYINEATRVHCVQIDDKYEREMREYNDIKNLNPKYNKKLPSLKVINRNAPPHLRNNKLGSLVQIKTK